MIIWINGTYSVGKTTVIKKIEQKLGSNKCKVISSDEFCEKNKEIFALGGGCYPQNNVNFNKKFKEYLDDVVNSNQCKYIIVDMALTDVICVENLFNHFLNSEKLLIHIILEASKENLLLRFKNDKKRDYQEMIAWVDNNLNFLKNNFLNATRINTDNNSVNEIVEKIVKIINDNNEGC